MARMIFAGWTSWTEGMLKRQRGCQLGLKCIQGAACKTCAAVALAKRGQSQVAAKMA